MDSIASQVSIPKLTMGCPAWSMLLTFRAILQRKLEFRRGDSREHWRFKVAQKWLLQRKTPRPSPSKVKNTL